jgi:hypothetical protein
MLLWILHNYQDSKCNYMRWLILHTYVYYVKRFPMCLLCINSMGYIYSRNMPYCMQCREACRDLETACRTSHMVKSPNSYPGGREFKSPCANMISALCEHISDPDGIMSGMTCSCLSDCAAVWHITGRLACLAGPLAFAQYTIRLMLGSGDFTCPCHGSSSSLSHS